MNESVNIKPLIVASHYSENLDWLVNQSQYPFVVYSKNATEAAKYNIPTDKFNTIPNKGKESSSYLKYIIDNYYKLPDHVAFCHGHDTAWHQDKTLIQALDEYSGEEFWSLNNTYYRNILYRGCPENSVWMHICWSWYAIDLPMPEIMEHTMSAQFVVPKESILRNSLQFYEKCYEFLMEQTLLEDLRLGIMFEQLWYYIMTHKTHEPKRVERTILDERGWNVCTTT
jgi:hypothetical protein